ncbi:MAG: carbohydrate ABC transporter permease [Thermoplasmata archaeon]|nr:carbohydrate ABC transporter permease [Candidatus Sysuiplasma acidicola]
MASTKRTVRDGVWYLLLLIITGFVLFPVYLIFLVAFADKRQVFISTPTLIPTAYTLSNLIFAIHTLNIIGPLSMSVETATMVALICLAVGVPAAYSISKLPARIRYAMIMFLFVTEMVPEIQIAVPIAALFIRLGLMNTAIGLALAQSSIAIPMITYILVGTFRTIPPNLAQSAAMDGAPKWRTFVSVELPLALTGVSVAAILAWLFSWDEFIFAEILVPFNQTIPPKIFYYITRGAGGIPAADAYSIILILPVIAMTFFLQKYLRSDVMAGALK